MSKRPPTSHGASPNPLSSTQDEVQNRLSDLEADLSRTYAAYQNNRYLIDSMNATVHALSRASLRRHGYLEGQVAGLRDNNYRLRRDFHRLTTAVRLFVASHDPGLTSPISRFLLEVIDDLAVPDALEYAPNEPHPSSPSNVRKGNMAAKMANYEGNNGQ